jgi:hypothetical protein
MVLRKLGQRTRATVEDEVLVVLLFPFSVALRCDGLIPQAAYFEDESAGLDDSKDAGDGGHADGLDLDSDENKVRNFV